MQTMHAFICIDVCYTAMHKDIQYSVYSLQWRIHGAEKFWHACMVPLVPHPVCDRFCTPPT